MATDSPLQFQIVRARLTDDEITILEEILAACKDGRITAFAIVAKEDGFARWSSWRAKAQRDRYNLIGQLTALTADITSKVNE